MQNPLFSIILPIFNAEKYIRQCVDSISNQSYKNFELILVDDGSPDHCPAICDDYAQKDQRIKVIHKENQGVSLARQTAVAVACGDYIVCVDADDWLADDYLEQFANVIKLYDADIVCCGAIWRFAGKDEEHHIPFECGFYNKAKMEQKIFPALIEASNGRYFPPSLWAKAFRRKLYEDHQLKNCKVDIGEDNACVKPCIYYAESMVLLKECLYFYRQNEESATKSRKAFSWCGPRLIAQHFEHQLPMDEQDFQKQIYRNVVHNLFNASVSQFNRKESYQKIKEDILREINDSYYRNAIEKSEYENSYYKGLLAKWSLKYKWVFLMRLYHKILYR